ncbi:unnamed protein product [Caretta caretta]
MSLMISPQSLKISGTHFKATHDGEWFNGEGSQGSTELGLWTPLELHVRFNRGPGSLQMHSHFKPSRVKASEEPACRRGIEAQGLYSLRKWECADTPLF